MRRFALRSGARSAGSVPPPVHKLEPSKEAHAAADKNRAAAIAARLRGMIRYSTDPAWLEEMARSIETRAGQRQP
jgi:hypothetical protein